MIYLIKFIYNTFILPPGIFIFLLFAVSGLLFRRDKKIASALILITFCLYITSTSYVSDLLILSLENRYHPPAKINGDVIIMLGGGATLDTPDIDGLGQLTGSAANRLLTTARLHIQTDLPIILSGSEGYKDSGNEVEIAKRQLLALGIPANKIIIENKSRNTQENALYTKKQLDMYKYKRPILVTSAFHMERSVRNFEKLGINIQPYPTDYQTSIKQTLSFNKFIPTYVGLSNTSITIKEYLGIAALGVFSTEYL